MNYYENQTRQNLDEAREIAMEEGTWDNIAYRHQSIVSNLESLSGQPDDDFSDCYRDSIDLVSGARG